MAEKSIRSEKTDELFKAVLSLNSIDDCYAFFEDLCTVKELSSMVQRYEVARLLHDGKTFTTISEQTGASPATITASIDASSMATGTSKRSPKANDPRESL